MNRAALPQAGESQRPLWFCSRFRGHGGGGPGCCGEGGEGANTTFRSVTLRRRWRVGKEPMPIRPVDDPVNLQW